MGDKYQKKLSRTISLGFIIIGLLMLVINLNGVLDIRSSFNLRIRSGGGNILIGITFLIAGISIYKDRVNNLKIAIGSLLISIFLLLVQFISLISFNRKLFDLLMFENKGVNDGKFVVLFDGSSQFVMSISVLIIILFLTFKRLKFLKNIMC